MTLVESLVQAAHAFEVARSGDRAVASTAAKHLSSSIEALLPATAKDDFQIRAGLGMGSFPNVPWIAVFHRRWNYAAAEGYFVVYLFTKDSKRIYFTLGVGAGKENQAGLRTEGKEAIEARAAELRAASTSLEPYGFKLDSDLELGSDHWRPRSYAAGTAAYVTYEVGKMPSAEVVERQFLAAFSHFEKLISSGFNPGPEPIISPNHTATAWKSDAVTMSLLSKSFLILTGPSGTGKTRSAVKLSKELCGNDARTIVAVGADWTDNRHVLGYLNPLEKDEDEGLPIYESTAILDLLRHANEHPEEPHVLILDEMNLSHVERYFADFLSAMELEDASGALRLHGSSMAMTRDGDEIPSRIDFPGNLLVIGTVNIDETTYMFSPKVLDRANVIEVGADKDGIEALLRGKVAANEAEEPEERGIGFLEAASVIRSGSSHESIPQLPDPVRQEAANVLMHLFDILEKGRGEFGFRTAKEVTAYLRAAHFLAGPDAAKRNEWVVADKPGEGWLASLDEQILQKILPKLHGGRSRLAPLLGALATFTGSGDPVKALQHFPDKGNPPARSLTDSLNLPTPRFPRSYAKLSRMIVTLMEEQFVSFIC